MKKITNYSTLRRLSETRLDVLSKQYRILSEGTKKHHLSRSIVLEARRLEKLMILEAISNMDQEELNYTFNNAIRLITLLSHDLEANGLYEFVNQLQVDAEDMLMLGQADPKSMKKFMNKMSDVMVIIKGLTAIGDAINAGGLTEASGLSSQSTIKDFIGSVKSLKNWQQMSLGDALEQLKTDDEIAGKPKNRFSLFGGGKTSDSKSRQFMNELKIILRSASPNFMKIIGENNVNELLISILDSKLTQVQKTFDYFLRESTEILSDKDLLKMAEPGIMGTLKNIAGFFSGGSATPRI